MSGPLVGIASGPLDDMRSLTRQILVIYGRRKVMRLLGRVDPTLDLERIIAEIGVDETIQFVRAWADCRARLGGVGLFSFERWRAFIRVHGEFRRRGWVRGAAH
jgi:hypothetical protein